MPIDSERTIARFQVEHVRVRLTMPFAEVVAGFRAATGALDIGEVRDRVAAGHRPEAILEFIAGRAGTSGLMRFAEFDHGAMLRLQGRAAQATRFLVGHPLIAASLAQRVLETALYTPLSVLIREDSGGTWLEYDLPSSLLAQFDDPGVKQIAASLDEKLGALIRSIQCSGSSGDVA